MIHIIEGEHTPNIWLVLVLLLAIAVASLTYSIFTNQLSSMGGEEYYTVDTCLHIVVEKLGNNTWEYTQIFINYTWETKEFLPCIHGIKYYAEIYAKQYNLSIEDVEEYILCISIIRQQKPSLYNNLHSIVQAIDNPISIYDWTLDSCDP